MCFVLLVKKNTSLVQIHSVLFTWWNCSDIWKMNSSWWLFSLKEGFWVSDSRNPCSGSGVEGLPDASPVYRGDVTSPPWCTQASWQPPFLMSMICLMLGCKQFWESDLVEDLSAYLGAGVGEAAQLNLQAGQARPGSCHEAPMQLQAPESTSRPVDFGLMLCVSAQIMSF